MPSPSRRMETIFQPPISPVNTLPVTVEAHIAGEPREDSSSPLIDVSLHTASPKHQIEIPQAELPLTSSQSTVISSIGNQKSTPSSTISQPPKGAWSVPIKFPLSAPTQQHIGSTSHDVLSSPELWPTLEAAQRAPRNCQIPSETPSAIIAGPPIQISTNHKETRAEDDLRFPWAAKMNPSMRNLYRATAPVYLEDGTPKVSIPSHVLLKGLENQKEFVLGQFYRCSPPPGGLIHAVVNRIWGRKCKIFIRKLGESNYLFHIPDASTRAWVLQRGLWHVDDCLLFVAPWTPASTLAIPEISTVPVWVTLKNIPNQLYSISGISHIASGLGAPMATNKPRLDPTLMGEAKILVEIELSKAFPLKIAADDQNGCVSMVDVEYTWVPTKCGRCEQLGHKVSRCLQQPPSSQAQDSKSAPILTKYSTEVASTVGKTKVPIPNIVSITEVQIVAEQSPNTITEKEEVSPTTFPELATSFAIEAAPILDSDQVINLAVTPVTNETIEKADVAAILEISEDIATNEVNPSYEVMSTSQSIIPSEGSSFYQSHGREVIEPTATNSLVFEAENAGLSLEGANSFGLLESLDSSEMDSLDDMDMSVQRTLRGRVLKPSQKIQEMQWTTVYKDRGDKKRGDKGRGGKGGRGIH